ncbi:MAG: hypothetical protein ACYDAQ_16185, partial [Mycobacteriales bacterium]
GLRGGADGPVAVLTLRDLALLAAAGLAVRALFWGRDRDSGLRASLCSGRPHTREASHPPTVRGVDSP